ncbi:MAG: ATPase, T2SS/T4P/T4SS family [Limnobacter sp.]|nr:ATPase, T2SS/T4P/T4SS family [Limnobacter sp.]
MNNDTDRLLTHYDLNPEQWLALGIAANLSDLHLTPKSKHIELGARTQGQMLSIGQLSMNEGRKLIQKLKSASKMNVADSRAPQDGRIHFSTGEARLASHPCLYGETLSIRLFGDRRFLKLDSLGLGRSQQQLIEHLLNLEQGLTLVCGPTGSGKTTLLHAGLRYLSARAGRVITLEDPVEIQNDQAIQTDLSVLPNLSFANGLRSVMRQDPDTLLVGEIRDEETATLCLHAALTGHRVLATVHAPTTIGAVSRLVELGVSLPSLLNCLNGVVSLRLHSGVTESTPRLQANILSLTTIDPAQVLDIRSLSELYQLAQHL